MNEHNPLTLQGIVSFLLPALAKAKRPEIMALDSIDSTSNLAKQYVHDGMSSDQVLGAYQKQPEPPLAANVQE